MVEGKVIFTAWGQLDGEMSLTKETCKPVNVGRKNEKSAEKVAQKKAADYIKAKVEKGGYVEVDPETNEPLEEVGESGFDFNKPQLNSTSFRIYKPQNSMNAYMMRLATRGEALFMRKRDGYMHYVVVAEGGCIDIYSSNWARTHALEPGIPLRDRFPHIINAIRRMRLPDGTVIAGEICTSHEYCVDSNGLPVDDFQYVGSVLKSLTDKALTRQKENGRLSFAMWDIIFLGTRPVVKEWPTMRRYKELANLVRQANLQWATLPEFVRLEPDGVTIECLDQDLFYEVPDIDWDSPINDIVNLAKMLGWEGYVVVDPNATYGDKSWSLHGKNERPKYVCKLKPDIDVDVIVYWDPKKKLGIYGKGKHEGGVGSVQAFLWHPECGELDVGRVGIGITDEQAREFADPSLYPMVWKVTAKGWTDSGKMRHAALDYVREDKHPEDCGHDQCPVELVK
jgi:hypothetical protein